MSAHKALAIIAGAGPGTGAAIARVFASKGFAVALLARTASKLATLEAEITQSGGTAASFPTDLTQPHSLKETFNSIHAKFPDSNLKAAIFNVNSQLWAVKPFLELQEEEFNKVVHGHVGAAFGFAQHVLKEMQKEGGTLIFTGATAATRGSARFAAFASACFAVRALSQSLAREFQPQGIHVAHAIIDGGIETERVKALGANGSAAAGELLDPSEIAKAFLFLHEQAPSAWTQELDLRPSKEKW